MNILAINTGVLIIRQIRKMIRPSFWYFSDEIKISIPIAVRYIKQNTIGNMNLISLCPTAKCAIKKGMIHHAKIFLGFLYNPMKKNIIKTILIGGIAWIKNKLK